MILAAGTGDATGPFKQATDVDGRGYYSRQYTATQPLPAALTPNTSRRAQQSAHAMHASRHAPIYSIFADAYIAATFTLSVAVCRSQPCRNNAGAAHAMPFHDVTSLPINAGILFRFDRHYCHARRFGDNERTARSHAADTAIAMLGDA